MQQPMNYSTPRNSQQLLESLERATYGRQYELAYRQLLQVLVGLEGEPSQAAAYQYPDKQLTRIAAAITALLADPKFALSQQGYEQLVSRLYTTRAVFAASSFGDAGHLARLIGDGEEEKRRLTMGQVCKLLSATSLDTISDELLDALPTLPDNVAVPAIISLLCQEVVLSPRAERIRQRLIELGPIIERSTLSDAMATLSASAWMLCSYSESDGKHAVKPSINRALRNWLATKSAVLASPPRAKRTTGKPTLLIVLEAFGSRHAMYRCYAVAIRSLRRKFHLVALVDGARIDDVARALFDDVMETHGRPSDVKEVVDRVATLSPDMVYFPSIGMWPMAVWLANIRLAPIQFMSPGHPASSFCSDIDYILLGNANTFEPERFSETIIVLDQPGMLHTSPPQATEVAPLVRRAPDVIRIAVTANAAKLSSAFIGVCERLQSRSKRQIEFCFFPNTTDVQTKAIRAELGDRLQRVSVQDRAHYASYLDSLRNCDLALGPFPFGGANSAVDALRLALPLVAMDGPEFHTGTERRYISACGLPDWLIAEDIDSYEAAAMRLINDDEERYALANALIGRTDRVLLEEHHACFPDEFLDAVSWLYCNHSRLVNEDRKTYVPQDRKRIPIANPGARQ